jgi:phage tail protein X
MELAYQTKDGDVLDAICWKYYGSTTGMVEKVLEAQSSSCRTWQYFYRRRKNYFAGFNSGRRNRKR